MAAERFTLLLTCYNFERYIKEAVESALAQTYEPLDIIISDDCSTDRSWEIIQKTVSAYKGPHHVILNRNETNLGFAANLNKSFGMARTDWVLNQSGDDLSLPTRVERYAEVIAANPNVRCVGAWFEAIDGEGKVMPKPKWRRQLTSTTANRLLIPMVIGVVAAYHMDVFRVFGPMSTQVWNEDTVLPFRAKLLGDIGWVDEVLVHYRFHDANMSGGKAENVKLHIAAHTNRRLPAFFQQMIDLYVAERLFPERGREFRRMRRRIERESYLKWLGSNWTLHPTWRNMLLGDLLCSPIHVIYLLQKGVDKLRRKVIGC